MAHPDVTSAIIGPRTVEQLKDTLSHADTCLGDDVLDAIDAIVPPGTDVNPDDPAYWPREIKYAELRRRPASSRSAVEDSTSISLSGSKGDVPSE
jgi:aryl-alcohol dehydrogenase (NADP+)